MHVVPTVETVERVALTELAPGQFVVGREGLSEWPDFIVVRDGGTQRYSLIRPTNIPRDATRVVYTCGTVTLTVLATKEQ